MNDPIESFVKTYHDLNAAVVEEIMAEPSPLEFMRLVARNRPFVARRVASEWKAVKRWDAAYLQHAMGKDTVNVAVTPLGYVSISGAAIYFVLYNDEDSNADAVVEQENGELLFVEPHEQFEPFQEVLDYIREDSSQPTDCRGGRNVKYAQTQNDNLRGEYNCLFTDVPKDIPFARVALQKEADAINLWIGSERSSTALHKDNYENIYVLIRGQKHFVMLSPVEQPCVNEQSIPRARYKLSSKLSQNGDGDWTIENAGAGEIPIAIWDPDEPKERTSRYSCLAKPLRVTLNEGDMLYLPAMWYHKVSQTAGEEGFSCAVNYWYDMQMDGFFWAANGFLRDVANAKAKLA